MVAHVVTKLVFSVTAGLRPAVTLKASLHGFLAQQETRMPPCRRVSHRQLEVLLAFTEANKDIALGRCTRGPQASQIAQRAWETVSVKLNSVADGVTKNAEQWRRYWVEWKAKTKSKGADIRRSTSKTGGGPNKLTPLSDLEQRILQIIGTICVEGLPGVQIPFPNPCEASLDPQPSTSQATQPSQESFPSSEIEVEWLDEDNDDNHAFLHLHQSPAHTPFSPPPQSSHPLQSSCPPPISSQLPESATQQRLLLPVLHQPQSPPSNQPQITPSNQQQSAPVQRPQTQRRSGQLSRRNRDVPQWMYDLEERRLAIEERHTRALESLSATLERRLGNIEDILSKICNK